MTKTILLSLLLPIALLAKTYILEESYLINDDTIMASDIIAIDKQNDFMIDRFGGRNSVQLSAAKLIRKFAAKDITIDTAAPIITFYYVRNIDLDLIKERVREKFIETYPSMQIDEIRIKPLSFGDFGALDIVQIDIGKNTLRRSKGSFVVWFGNEESKVKRGFFAYEIDASMKVIKTSRTLAGGTIVSADNTKISLIAFEQLSDVPIDESRLGKIVVKGRLGSDEILTSNRVITLPDVRKKSDIRVEIVQHGVKLTFIATAQKDANIGEIIDVKDQNGKIHRVRIISKELARQE
jgi:flagella basal body P-ring formation protein FlgA